MRYAGADEWYMVSGGRIRPGDPGGLTGLEELHERVIGRLTTPGLVVEGNEGPVSLPDFSPLADGK